MCTDVFVDSGYYLPHGKLLNLIVFPLEKPSGIFQYATSSVQITCSSLTH